MFVKSMTDRESDHLSYKRHRRQVWTHILLPVIVAVLVILAVIVAASQAAFRGDGDSGRWAAIATIELTIPVIMAGIVILAVLSGVAFALGKAGGILPPYSLRAQRFTRRVESSVKQGGEMLRRPQLAIRAIANRARARGSGNAERMKTR
jgi:hypothetical protein